MSSRMRVTKGHSGNRRSHHALKAPRLSLCPNCGEYYQRHRVCKSCGFYKGNEIIIKKDKNNLKEAVSSEPKEEKKEVVKKTKAKKEKKDTSKKKVSKKETKK